MGKTNKRKAQQRAVAENARQMKKSKKEALMTTANEGEFDVDYTQELEEDYDNTAYDSQCESDSEFVETDGDEEPTEADWNRILGTMKKDTPVSMKYVRGCQENRVTTWRHGQRIKEQEKTVKDCPKITTFFAVSLTTAGSLAVVDCVLSSVHSLHQRIRAIKLKIQAFPACMRRATMARKKLMGQLVTSESSSRARLPEA